MSVEQKIEEQRQKYLRLKSIYFDSHIRHWQTESPIEHLFFASILAHGWVHTSPDSFMKACDKWEAACGREAPSQILVRFADDWLDKAIYMQGEVDCDGRIYRLDFSVLNGWNNKIAVEIDGHDFHERTKEQAQRDKSRDRSLSTAGWSVLRFTGSEVYRDVQAVYDELMGHMCESSNRSHDREEAIRVRLAGTLSTTQEGSDRQ